MAKRICRETTRSMRFAMLSTSYGFVSVEWIQAVSASSGASQR
jgi:hypothetical protein